MAVVAVVVVFVAAAAAVVVFAAVVVVVVVETSSVLSHSLRLATSHLSAVSGDQSPSANCLQSEVPSRRRSVSPLS